MQRSVRAPLPLPLLLLPLGLLLPALLLQSVAALPDEDNDDNVLHIGGIFPIGGEGGWQGGQVGVVSRCLSVSLTLAILFFLPLL